MWIYECLICVPIDIHTHMYANACLPTYIHAYLYNIYIPFT